VSQDPKFQPSPIVYDDPIKARERLHQLGLTPEQLRAGLGYGITERRNCTANDPLWLVGILTTGKITRGLRDQLVKQGWTVDNRLNYATVIHPTGQLAIAVSSANEHAGDPFNNPSTRAEKGIATDLAVTENQAGFWMILPQDFRAPPEHLPTYLFLYHINDDKGILGAELSLPIRVSEDGLIREFRERIPLFPADLDDGVRRQEDDADPGGGGEEIHIEVERRAS
jgi:hypothetical protein